MNNTTLELSNEDYNTLILREDGNPRRVIRIMDESDASHYISSNVCLYGKTGGPYKPGEELMLTSDVIVADDLDEFFFRGRDWRVLKQLNLTEQALELVKEMCEGQRG